MIIEGNLVLPSEVRFGQLVVDGPLISRVVLDQSDFSTPNLRVPKGDFISPGFIDLQINGAFGKEFKSDSDAIDAITSQLPRFGTTSIYPTVTTRELGSYSAYLTDLLAHYSHPAGTRILGFHLEGPFLNPAKVGAQNAALLKTPDECSYSDYVSNDVAIVTLSPELKGAPTFIARLLRDGKRVGIGHSTVSYEEITELFDPHQMMVVHVFNAMDGIQPRSPGLAGAALDKDNYFVSLIVDGIHIDPVIVRITWKAKMDKNKVICITDGSAVTGLPEGTYTIGTRRIQRKADRAVLEGTTTLVGSVLTQNVAARNLRAFTMCSLNEAVNAVSLNPATLMGREHEFGQLAPGTAADIVIHDDEFVIKQTFVGGTVVWSRSNDE